MIKKIIPITLLAISFNASALTCTGVINEIKVSKEYGFVEVYSEAFNNSSVLICGELDSLSNISGAKSLRERASETNGGYANICKAWIGIAEISIATGLPVKFDVGSYADDCSGVPSNSFYYINSLSLTRENSNNAE